MDLAGRHADRLAQPRELLPALALRPRQLGRLELERQRGPVGDERLSVAIQDLAARRPHRDLADLVVLGRLRVLVPGQHLEVPEAEEDDREHHQRQAAEDRHAKRELRRHQGSLPLAEHHGRETPAARLMRRPRALLARDAPRVMGLLAPSAAEVVDQRRAQGPADQRIDRDRQDHRQQALDEDLTQHQEAHRRVHAQHQLDRGKAGGGGRRQHARQERRDQRVGHLRALAVATGEVAGAEQDQRRDPERLEQRRVEQQPGGEPAYRADHRAAQQAQRDDHQRNHVRRRPEEAQVGEERDLEHDRDDHDQRDPERDPPGDDHPGTPGRLGPPVATWTKSSPRMSA